MRLDYAATEDVHEAIASIGRTEDVKFSPNNRRIALAEFENNRITVLDISGAATKEPNRLVIAGVAHIYSPDLSCPHGLDFIDDEKIVVTNREGGVCIFELPEGANGRHVLSPVDRILSRDLITPGSICVVQRGKQFEALVCNNYVNKVTRHTLFDDRSDPNGAEALLNKWLDIPDGIAVSNDRQWIAVSNHNTHNVLIYSWELSLDALSDPRGILQGINYPHGVRFSADDRYIFVADAGSPYVHLYSKNDFGWAGVHRPFLSARVLNDEQFLRGRRMRAEGGPKGLDVNCEMNLLVTTCGSQPVAFFDLGPVLEKGRNVADVRVNYAGSRQILNVKCALYLGKMRLRSTTALRRTFNWLPILHSIFKWGRERVDRHLVKLMPQYKKRL